MLLHFEGDDVVCIGQAAHSWISGQLARQWGNDAVAPPEPLAEVCLGAEQHDIGMAEWDRRPELNPETGYPVAFLELPLATHIALWTEAPEKILSQSPYAALLVSMHGHALFNEAQADAGDRALPARAGGASRPTCSSASARTRRGARRNQQLVWALDYLALVGLIPRVGAAGQPGRRLQHPRRGRRRAPRHRRPVAVRRATRSPSPTRAAASTEPSATEPELHARLAAAPWVDVRSPGSRIAVIDSRVNQPEGNVTCLKVAVVGSGAIACGLASVAAAKLGEAVLVARSEESAERARAQATKAIEKARGRPEPPDRHDRPRRARRPHLRRRGDRRGPRPQGRAARPRSARELDEPTRCSPAPRPRCRSRTSPRPAAAPEHFAALHVFNPVAAHGAHRARLPRRRHRRRPRSARARCARRSARPASRWPTSPASSSTACCSRTSSTPSRVMEEQGLDARGRRHLHEARRRPPDGPARAAGLRRPRRLIAIGEQVGVEIPQGRARPARRRASSAASRARASTLLARVDALEAGRDCRSDTPSSHPLQRSFAAGSLP